MPANKERTSSTSTKKDPTIKQVMEQISDNGKYMEDQFKLLNDTLSSLSARITTLEGKQTDIEKSLTFHGDEISDLQ